MGKGDGNKRASESGIFVSGHVIAIIVFVALTFPSIALDRLFGIVSLATARAWGDREQRCVSFAADSLLPVIGSTRASKPRVVRGFPMLYFIDADVALHEFLQPSILKHFLRRLGGAIG